MAQPPKFTVGQEVWCVGRHRGGQRTTVTKVGRLYFSVAHVTGTQFALATGFEKGDRHGNGYRVRTLDEQAAVDRRAAAGRALAKVGLTVDWTRRACMPIETMEALALVADDHEPGVLPDHIANAIATIKGHRAAAWRSEP